MRLFMILLSKLRTMDLMLVVYHCSNLLVLSFHVICYLVLCFSIFIANVYQCSTVVQKE